MKTTIFIFICFVITNSLLGQTKLIEVKPNFDLVEGQMVNSFVILENDKDKFISNCLTKWGEPVENTYGLMKWKNLSIPSIGNKITIKLLNGYTTRIGNTRRVDSFKSEKEKDMIIKVMTDKQERLLMITLFNKKGDSIDLNSEKIEIIKTYLAELF